MKTIHFSFLFLLMICFSGIATAQTKTPSIDPKNSTIEWTGKKVLGQHNGTVNIADGKLIINGALLTGGEFTIDMNSITNIDLKDTDYNQKLIGHLKSPDFFSVDKYPTANVLIKKVQKYTAYPDKYKVTADVTIKGISSPVVFDAVLTKKGDKYIGSASIVLDRTKWDVKYGSSSFFDNLGDKAIKNEIELNIKIQTI